MNLGYFLALLVALASPSWQFTTEETCEFCQAVLRGVHGYIASSSNAPTKRVLARQLRHHCNRHFEYRRRCLVLVKMKFPQFLEAMRHRPFKPVDTCLTINECRPGPPETAVPLISGESGPWEKELETFFATLNEARTFF